MAALEVHQKVEARGFEHPLFEAVRHVEGGKDVACRFGDLEDLDGQAQRCEDAVEGGIKHA